jgi:hypothetical protein
MRLNDPSFPVSSTNPALTDKALGVVGGLVKLMTFQQIKNAVDSVGSSVTVEDVLTSTNTDNALSAAQGKILNDALVLKAPLASPIFTGTPATPTADTGTSTTQIASTAFVQQEISQITFTTIGAEEAGAAATALSDANNYADDLVADLCPLVDGLVPSANLPSFVDDALEFANLAAFPVTGESGKIYIAINDNTIYRWTGSIYVLIGDGTSVDVVGVGASSFVRYDVAQTLSNDDKARVQTTLGMSIYALASSLSSYLTSSSAASTYGTIAQAKTEYLVLAASDESTALTTGTSKITFRMPYAFTLTAVRCSLTTAQTSGSILTVDINESGTTILSTKLTIDNTEKTSTTAATAAVISDVNLADDAEITIDIDQVGDGTAKGLKITLIGTRT